MNSYVALLRAINVGGRNRLHMRELLEDLGGMGLQGVRTHGQSGNVVVHSEETSTSALSERISVAVGRSHGFTPQVLVLKLGELERAVASNPYPEAESSQLHLYFLAIEPEDPDLVTLESTRADTERFTLKGKVLYLHAPEGIGRSKLAARVERALGVSATARNWRTVSRLLAMAGR